MSRIILPGERAFYINRNRWAEIESRAKVGVEGRYTLRAIKPGVGVVREATFPNIFTNLGMDSLGSAPAFARMHLGTGSATPLVTDTSLDNFGTSVVNSAASLSDGVVNEPPYYVWRRMTWTSAVGGATGTWTEIGVSNQNTNGNLRSRALILDNNQQPTSFPVLADEQFEGTYEFRLYAPASDSFAAVSIGGASYDTVTRAAHVTSSTFWRLNEITSTNANRSLFMGSIVAAGDQAAYAGDIAAVTSAPSDSPLGSRTSQGTYAYGGGNHYIDTFARWGPGAGVGSIKSLFWRFASGALQIQLDPVLVKLATEEFIHNQRISWARR